MTLVLLRPIRPMYQEIVAAYIRGSELCHSPLSLPRQVTAPRYRAVLVSIAFGVLYESLLALGTGRAADAFLLIFGAPGVGVTAYHVVTDVTHRPQRRLSKVAAQIITTLTTDTWILFWVKNASNVGISNYGIQAANNVITASNAILPLPLRLILPEPVVLIVIVTIAVYIALQ